MKNLFEELFYNHVKNVPNTEYTKQLNKRLLKNEKLLKERLNRNERKLLLRIVDNKDLISEEKMFDSFIYGFQLGLKIGYETNRKYTE